jgi:hypothetical protein
MNEMDMLGPGTKHEPPRRPAALQGGSELAVVGQPLLDHGFLLGGAVDLPSAAAGIETVKTQRRRSRMADAVEQAAAEVSVVEGRRWRVWPGL